MKIVVLALIIALFTVYLYYESQNETRSDSVATVIETPPEFIEKPTRLKILKS